MLRVELGFHAWQLRASGFYGSGATWRFMGGYQWSYKSSNMGYKYSYPTYNPTYNYP